MGASDQVQLLNVPLRLSDGKLVVPSVEEMKNYKIVVTTLATARTLALMELPKGHFTHIFIDEAAQVKTHFMCY